MSEQIINAQYEYSFNQRIDNQRNAKPLPKKLVKLLNSIKLPTKLTDVSDTVHANMSTIFNSVTNTENWKEHTQPVSVRTIEQAAKLMQIIGFFAGAAEVDAVTSNLFVVTSKGYYWYIGA